MKVRGIEWAVVTGSSALVCLLVWLLFSLPALGLIVVLYLLVTGLTVALGKTKR
jgi:hypothetical protein